MGDRYNVGIAEKDNTGAVNILWFYSHYGFVDGYFRTVANALDFARDRWDDKPYFTYFTRIIISHLLEGVYDGGTGADSLTGSGIAVNKPTLVDHKQLVVNVDKRLVALFDDAEVTTASIPILTWSFDKFIEKYQGEE